MTLRDQVRRDGFAFVPAAQMEALLAPEQPAAWNDDHARSLAGRQLGSFTLSAPLDTALVDDARVRHGVTPVEPLDAAQPAYRDVLVVTLRSK